MQNNYRRFYERTIDLFIHSFGNHLSYKAKELKEKYLSSSDWYFSAKFEK